MTKEEGRADHGAFYAGIDLLVEENLDPLVEIEIADRPTRIGGLFGFLDRFLKLFFQ
jgi:hypothetical protein